jgi:hypothetical protein
MTTKTKATHNGTCQACGRKQAYTPRGIANHGYTTRWGFFSGTCAGSNHAPLELETAFNVTTVAAIREWADKQDAKAASEITTVTVKLRTRNDVGRIVEENVDFTKAEYVERFATKKYGDHENANEWTARDFDRRVEEFKNTLTRAARSARIDADALEALRDKVHGNELEAREVADAPKRTREYMASKRDAYTKQAELKKQGISSTVRSNRYGEVTISYVKP